MIRDIGQRGHEKRRKSGIVRGRGKAGGGGGGQKKKKEKKTKTKKRFFFLFFSFFLCPPPPPPGPSRPLKGPPYSSETLKASLPLPLQDLKA